VRIAQLISLCIFALGAIWYARPLLRSMTRADALTALLWIHVFRYTAIFAISAQHEGLQISNTTLYEIVTGDLVGALIALLAIALLRARRGLGVILAWLVVVETLADFAFQAHRRLLEPLLQEPTGVLALVLTFLVPLVIVSLPLLAWQLTVRRNEPLTNIAAGIR
jgi:hypothetical protein